MERHFRYVEAYLMEHGGNDRSEQAGQRFRKRADHIRRVMMWLERLLAKEGGVEDPAALRLAAVFHDAGYARAKEDHGRHSADILREYAARAGLSSADVERAAFLVAEHSNKEMWMPRADAPRDLILLMEADLLDEEGAMGLVLDCMTAGQRGAEAYEEAYRQMLRYEPKRLERAPMVTETGRALWAEKQRIIEGFMRAFAYDLGIVEGISGEIPSWLAIYECLPPEDPAP